MDRDINKRDGSIKNVATIIILVLFIIVGAFMMTLTSSPQMKGAAMLWLPAALQLIAGVWLGWKRGLIAGGLGAYGAGIIAYGGWGLVDIIMNLLAGGIANAALPAILFKIFKINPDFNSKGGNIGQAIVRVGFLLIIIIIMGVLPLFFEIGQWAYLGAILISLIGFTIVLKGVQINKPKFIIALLICVFVSLVSALMGSYGVHLSGNSWEASLLGTGLGWFLGDTVSCVLGLYILIYFTTRARERGITSN